MWGAWKFVILASGFFLRSFHSIVRNGTNIPTHWTHTRIRFRDEEFCESVIFSLIGLFGLFFLYFTRDNYYFSKHLKMSRNAKQFKSYLWASHRLGFIQCLIVPATNINHQPTTDFLLFILHAIWRTTQNMIYRELTIFLLMFLFVGAAFFLALSSMFATHKSIIKSGTKSNGQVGRVFNNEKRKHTQIQHELKMHDKFNIDFSCFFKQESIFIFIEWVAHVSTDILEPIEIYIQQINYSRTDYSLLLPNVNWLCVASGHLPSRQKLPFAS